MRLVEMLVERGAKRVVCFDIVPPPEGAWKHERIEYVIGDITNLDDVVNASKGADCVWHLAAAVGPFHPDELYMRINYEGTLIEAGKTVAISTYGSHRDPAFFPDPETFNPRRDRVNTPEMMWAYIPFGGGPHKCAGNAFAMM